MTTGSSPAPRALRPTGADSGIRQDLHRGLRTRCVRRRRRPGRGGADRAAPAIGAELPIGITLSLTDTPTGLDGEWRISETEFGTEVLTLVRDKALRNLSAGFAEGRNRWHTRDRVTRLSTTLDHAALVRRGAYPGACLRSAHGQADPLQILGPPPTVSALARPCLVCGQPVVGASRCPSCAPAKAKRKTAAPGTAQHTKPDGPRRSPLPMAKLAAVAGSRCSKARPLTWTTPTTAPGIWASPTLPATVKPAAATALLFSPGAPRDPWPGEVCDSH